MNGPVVISQLTDLFFKEIEQEITTEVNSRLQNLITRTVEENKTKVINNVMEEYRVKAKVQLLQGLEHSGLETRISLTSKKDLK